MAKVTQFHIPVVINEDVEWLQISVDYSFGVDEKQTFEYLEGQILDMVRVHCVLVKPDHIHQVLSAILSDDVQLLETLRVLGSHDRLHLDDVVVTSEEPQELQLSQDTVSVDIVLKNILDLLDSDIVLLLVILTEL